MQGSKVDTATLNKNDPVSQFQKCLYFNTKTKRYFVQLGSLQVGFLNCSYCFLKVFNVDTTYLDANVEKYLCYHLGDLPKRYFVLFGS